MILWSFISTTNVTTVILAYICLILKKFSVQKSLAVLSSGTAPHLSPHMVNSGLTLSGLSGPFTDSSSVPTASSHLQRWFYLWLQNRHHPCGDQFSVLSFFRPNWGTHAISWFHLSFPLWWLQSSFSELIP